MKTDEQFRVGDLVFSDTPEEEFKSVDGTALVVLATSRRMLKVRAPSGMICRARRDRVKKLNPPPIAQPMAREKVTA